MHAAYAAGQPPSAEGIEPVDAQEAVDAAVASGDEHAIKLAEAAVRAGHRCADPALLAAVADAAVRLAG